MRGSQLCAAIICGALYGGAPIANAIEPDLSEKRLQTAGLDEGAIEPERLSVLIGRAMEAATAMQQGRQPHAEETPGTNNLLRIDTAIKAAAFDLWALRNYLRANDLPGGKRTIQWPQWMLEPPTDKTPLKVLRARIDWLNDNVFPVTDPVCDLAAKQTDDHLVCSVE